jgi:hypothetical protein
MEKMKEFARAMQETKVVDTIGMSAGAARVVYRQWLLLLGSEVVPKAEAKRMLGDIVDDARNRVAARLDDTPRKTEGDVILQQDLPMAMALMMGAEASAYATTPISFRANLALQAVASAAAGERLFSHAGGSK